MPQIKVRDRCKAVIIDHEILKIWSVSVNNVIEIKVKRKLFTEKWKWQLFWDDTFCQKETASHTRKSYSRSESFS